jgi:hypothetical protein
MYIFEKYNSRTELKITVNSDKLDENFALVDAGSDMLRPFFPVQIWRADPQIAEQPDAGRYGD